MGSRNQVIEIEELSKQVKELKGLACKDRFAPVENKGSPFSEEIRSAMMVDSHNEPNFEKFNGDGDSNSHLQGFEYTMEWCGGTNDNLKSKYFVLSLIGEWRKWFLTRAP